MRQRSLLLQGLIWRCRHPGLDLVRITGIAFG
jgi:hypothetical protein